MENTFQQNLTLYKHSLYRSAEVVRGEISSYKIDTQTCKLFFHVWKEGIEQDSTAWTAEMGIFRISNTSIFNTIICLKLALLRSFVSLPD